MNVLFYVAAGGRALLMPNYGIATVASPLLDHCAVELADCSNDLETSDGYGSLSPSPEYIQRQVSKICAGGYDFACFQIHSGNLLASSLILENLASEPAKPQIVIGGPSANIVYLPYSRRGLADYYFFGDSAETLFDFLVGGNSRPENMLRQEFKGTISPYRTPRRVWPYPDFARLYPNAEFLMMPILLTTGCAFDCAFCTSRRSLLGFNAIEDPRTLLQDFMAKYRPRLIRFNDSSFNAQRGTFLSALETLAEASHPVKWGAYTSLAAMRESDVQKMERARCAYVYIGLENADHAIRSSQRKGFSLSKAASMIRLLKEAGIAVLLSVIVGLPGENVDSIKRTEAFVLEAAPAAINVFCYEDRPELAPLYGDLVFWRTLLGRTANKRLAPQSHIESMTWNQVVEESLRLRDMFTRAGILYGEHALVTAIAGTNGST